MASLPPTPGGVAQLGVNCDITNPTHLALAKAAGFTYVRAHPGWESIEDYDNPGTYALPAGYEEGFAWCGANGLEPIIVCGYGPPREQVMTLTVTGGPHAPGAYTIPVTGSLASIVTPTDHVLKSPTTAVTAKSSYYGSLIDSVNVGGGTITLASATTITLNPGDFLVVNRLLYAGIASTDPNDPSVVAFTNLMRWVATRIAANGASGYVTIWNEPPWPNDSWDDRSRMYDTPPGGMPTVLRCKPIIQNCLAITDLPPEVRIISGATDKTGGNGIHAQSLTPAAQQIDDSIRLESIHPYHNLPEGFMWDRTSNNGTRYTLLNPTVDVASNFTNLSYAQDSADVGLGLIATEMGAFIGDDYHQALYLTRRTITSWGCRTIPVVYHLAVANNYTLVDSVTFEPRHSYTALTRLAAIGAGLGAGGEADTLPTLIGFSGGDWPLMMAGVYGGSGSALFLWQQTGHESATTWDTHPAPNAGTVTLQMPQFYSSELSAVDILTGAPLEFTIEDGVLTMEGIGEGPAALLLPAPVFTFTPPVTDGNLIGDPNDPSWPFFRHFGSWAQGQTVWKDSQGVWHQSTTPYLGGATTTHHDWDQSTYTGPDEGLATAQRVYLGGYDHTITAEEAEELIAAGYGDYVHG